MIIESFSFRNSLGYQKNGELTLPVATDNPTSQLPLVVCAHGLNSSEDSGILQALTTALQNTGFGTLQFDFTGHGNSEGSVKEATITQQVDDLENAVSLLRADGRCNPVGIYGEFTGATVAMRVASTDPFIKALVLQTPRADTDLSLPTKIKVPTLIVQGSADLDVRPESRSIFDTLAGQKDYLVLAGAGHLLEERTKDQNRTVEAAVNWFARYLQRAFSAHR